MINTCMECGEKFEAKRTTAKVCKECQNKEIQCPICGTGFVRKSTNQTTCGKEECKKQYKKIRPKKQPVMPVAEEEIDPSLTMDVKEFNEKPPKGTCVVEECKNCGGTKFIFDCRDENKNKGWVEYRCTQRGCAFRHIFKWGYTEKTE